MCILPTLKSKSYKNSKIPLQQRARRIEQCVPIKNKIPKKYSKFNRNNPIKKTLKNCSDEKPYYIKSLYFHCCNVDNIDEEATQYTRCIIYR